MAIRNPLSRPILSALALRLLLCPLATSLSLRSPRPPWTAWSPLRAAESAYDGVVGDGEASGDATPPPRGKGGSKPVKSFERVVRSVTGNEEYKFGDIARSVVNTTTHGIEGAVRTVTKNEDYEFGDLTKTALGSTTSGFEVRSATGNEDYIFGDLVRGTVKAADGVMTYSEKTLRVMRNNNIHELVELMNLYWTKRMTYDERKEAVVVFIYLGAILVLSYNFVANAMAGMVFAAAWARVNLTAGVSPLAPGMWTKFLETKATLDMFFGGPCLPARAILTIPWFFTYRKFVVTSAYKSPLREKFPILNRCLSLLLSWVVANLALLGGLTFAMVNVVTIWTGVAIFPPVP
ncbi:hypothetical protein ACHAWF_013181 [Thalassiosira exigua]